MPAAHKQNVLPMFSQGVAKRYKGLSTCHYRHMSMFGHVTMFCTMLVFLFFCHVKQCMFSFSCPLFREIGERIEIEDALSHVVKNAKMLARSLSQR